MDNLRTRCWAEISLRHISHNYKEIRKRLPEGCRFLGVVKADAYGHGAVQVAELLEREGADYLGVSCLDEAVKLRESGIKLPVLILGHTPPEYTEEIIHLKLTQTVVGIEAAFAYAERVRKSSLKLKCHLKVDSGMSRFGFYGSAREIELIDTLHNNALDVEGIFTHFAVSDCADDSFTYEQFDDFKSLCYNLEHGGHGKFLIKHCANSGAVVNCPWSFLDMVRPGIALYGHYPGETHGELSLLPAMSFKTRICQIKELTPGATVSYGREWKADKQCRIAVLPVGYADGLFRTLSNKASFLIRGKRAPLIGRICMDLCMVDISGIPEACMDDTVIVFGSDKYGVIHAEEPAKLAETISYELLCAVSARVPRVYI